MIPVQDIDTGHRTELQVFIRISLREYRMRAQVSGIQLQERKRTGQQDGTWIRNVAKMGWL